ncbi:S8 family serine peptidase [Bacteroides congonensis]|uniref:S8 family serine peptidase n=1 Tax=Bacteroides congonensis TaxID=1871006 RepID=UPI000336EAA1|nr:S8 family serine peptidase [Bacteroides congonensis]CDA85118.1 peptidase S8/S53 family [Bacteroides sp. CAG:754]
MKKLIFFISYCLICGTVSAQLVKQKIEKQKKQSELDWYNCSFDRDSVYGAEVNKAYEYLNTNKKKPKKRPIVALIGTGMDVEHEDLKQAIWVNPKEKLNQKDDDKNGLTDDINGWNFIGGKDGQVVESLTREGEREFFRLKDTYGDYIFDGKKYYKVINGKRQEVPAPENMEEYNYYRYKVIPESRIGGAYGGLQLSYVIEEYVEKFNRDMKQRFPGKELTVEEFQSCYDPKAERDSLSEVAFVCTAYYFSLYNTDKWEPVYQNMGKRSVETAKANYEKALAQYGTDNRQAVIGDNPLDINDNHYGNNILLTSDAATNVMKAGIIAAKRDNGKGSNGIADHAEIMTLRICTGEGEPYLKDMALAIRYAVSHGADVIVLPEQNILYPEEQKQWIVSELKEAENKGAIVIVPAWNTSVDMDKVEFFPNRKMSKDKELTNLMVVASSDKKGNPVMNTNYGANALDIYAPGTDIYSTYTGDTYRKGTGDELAAVTVAGVAALIKSYFPKLTGSQIRDILIKSVTSRKGIEVEKGIRVDDRPSQDLFLFDDLCISGGIVNAYQAILEAEKM